MSDNFLKRREFLKTLALLTATGLSGSVSKTAALSKCSYEIGPWTGDDFTLGHYMRDGKFPDFPQTYEQIFDFVIVGGGMAGLTAAYYLRDYNFLLLEQYAQLGGQSRGQTYRGIDYSLAAACMSSNQGIFAQLFSELDITPVSVLPAQNSWYWQGEWVPGVSAYDQLLFHKELKRLILECQPIWHKLPPWPNNMLQQMPELNQLDAITFATYLSGYDPKFIDLMDKFCLACLCGGVNLVSALAGIYLAQILVNPSYVFKGGNPAVARALVEKLDKAGSGRCLTNTFVWNISFKNDWVDIVYGTASGSIHRVRCRKVIVTVPPMVAARIIPDLDDQIKAALLWHKYGSYLVANFCMPKKIFNGSYDNWLGSPFTFAEVTIAETPYIATNSYKPEMGSVLTVYQPYPPHSAGRTILLKGNREELAFSLVNQLAQLVEQLQNNLEQVVLSRWGHAMVVAQPNFFAKLLKFQTLDTHPVIFAHNSTQGLPSAESAIYAAHKAAKVARGATKSL